MSSLFRPRRWPYDPNDPDQDQQDQSMYAPGPELGPAGGPPPPTPTPVDRPAAAEASMFQPNPTGPMPSQESLQGDAVQNATKSLYAPAQPDQAAPSPDRQAYSKPLERPEPPERIPYQKYNPFSLGHANAYAKQAVDAENAHNDHIYQLRLTAYEAEQRRLMESQYYRNLYGSSASGRAPQYVKDADGRVHLARYNPATDKWEVSGEEAYVPSVESAHVRGDTAMGVQGLKSDTAETVQGMRGATAESVAGTHARATLGAADIHGSSAVEAAKVRAETPRPVSPEKVDIRRQQLIKESQAKDEPEDVLAAKLAIYDRQNRPSTAKGIAAANQPPGKPHAPLGGKPQKNYVRTGTDAQGRRVGQLPDGTVEVIQ